MTALAADARTVLYRLALDCAGLDLGSVTDRPRYRALMTEARRHTAVPPDLMARVWPRLVGLVTDETLAAAGVPGPVNRTPHDIAHDIDELLAVLTWVEL